MALAGSTVQEFVLDLLIFTADLTKLRLLLMMLNYVKLIVLLIAVFFILRMLFSLFLPHNVEFKPNVPVSFYLQVLLRAHFGQIMLM